MGAAQEALYVAGFFFLRLTGSGANPVGAGVAMPPEQKKESMRE